MHHEQIRRPVALVFAVEARRPGAVGKAVRVSTPIGTSPITNERIADLYGLADTQKISVFEYDRAAAIKVTLPRSIPSGGCGDKDIYGAQQHSPLYDTLIPWDCEG